MPYSRFRFARREHELVHAEPVVRQFEGVSQPREHVVGVQHGRLGHLQELGAVGAHEGVRAHEHPEGACEAAYAPDRLRPIVIEPEDIAVTHDLWRGQEGLDRLAHRDRPASGPAAAVRLRERLVQVDSGRCRSPCRPVASGPRRRSDWRRRSRGARRRRGRSRATSSMPSSKRPERRRVGEHQPGSALGHLRAQIDEVEIAARVGRDLLQLVAGHRHARGIRAVCRVRGDDRVALLSLARVRRSRRASASGR